MAQFQEHIEQANRNLRFLQHANQSASEYWDWQVTVGFYVAVHLVNAHLAQKTGLSYRSHEQVNEAINPYNELSLTKFSEPDYLAYDKLQGLARRARYLCNEDRKNHDARAHFTYDKHFARAMRYLDAIMSFVNREYPSAQLLRIKVACVELRAGALTNVQVG